MINLMIVMREFVSLRIVAMETKKGSLLVSKS